MVFWCNSVIEIRVIRCGVQVNSSNHFDDRDVQKGDDACSNEKSGKNADRHRISGIGIQEDAHGDHQKPDGQHSQVSQRELLWSYRRLKPLHNLNFPQPLSGGDADPQGEFELVTCRGLVPHFCRSFPQDAAGAKSGGHEGAMRHNRPIPDLHTDRCEWPETLQCRVWAERAIQWRNKAEALSDRRSVGGVDPLRTSESCRGSRSPTLEFEQSPVLPIIV